VPVFTYYIDQSAFISGLCCTWEGKQQNSAYTMPLTQRTKVSQNSVDTERQQRAANVII